MQKSLIVLVLFFLIGYSSKADSKIDRVEKVTQSSYLFSTDKNGHAGYVFDHNDTIRYYYDKEGKIIEKRINDEKIKIIYDNDINVTKDSINDIKYLILFSDSLILPKEITVEYHEEYDKLGRKIFAYISLNDAKNRSMTYLYDKEGRLYAKTVIHYGEGFINYTVYYKKDGTIDHINEEKYKALKKRHKILNKMSTKIGFKKAYKIMNEKLRYTLF